MRFGAIYIAHNPRDGATIFKVGKTERAVDERMKELTASTSTLGIYTARASFVVNDVDVAEAACHKRLERYRVQNNREFFELPFSRLLQMVQEAIAPYAARDFVPELPVEDTPPTTPPRTAAEILQTVRQQKEIADKAWDIALEKARSTLGEWQRVLQEKAQQAATELQEVDILKWRIPNHVAIDRHQSNGGSLYFCSVTVLSRLSNKPLILQRSGLRGIVSIEEPDLSRAVAEPIVTSSTASGEQGNYEIQHIRWEEPDDGRIGRLSILPNIENRFKNERGTFPFPQLVVRATPIRYDDYHRNFEEQHHTEKFFNNPEEAFDIFLSLVIADSVVVQYDVRSMSTYRHHKDDSPRISDCGKLGIDHGIGHFMVFEVGSEAQAPAPPSPKSPQTSSAASDRKSAPLPSSRQAG